MCTPIGTKWYTHNTECHTPIPRYNFKTGIMRNASSPQFTDFVYNPTDGMVWGHGVAVGPKKTYFVRTLRKMDPSTLKVGGGWSCLSNKFMSLLYYSLYKGI